ncbi:MAG: DUF3261 domain-containing protein [Deltaproteobacteria bacterium]|nr:DUF3261 domain-containing protein [Deltaproteobacteria bacterium]
MLVDANDIDGSFLLEQEIRFRWNGRTGSSRAVIQHACGELTVLLLTPFGTPGVVVRQRGTHVESEVRAGTRLPFEPRRVLRDIHRGLFVRLAGPPVEDGRREAALPGGERVEEVWAEGRLRERSYRTSGEPREQVQVLYPEGLAEGEIPAALSIESRRFGYRLDITTLSRVAVGCSPQDSLPGGPPR